MSSDPQRILLIRLKSIGDVVLTLPAVHALRQNYPSAKITFLTSKENSGLLRGFREVDEVIALDRAALRAGNPAKVVPAFLGLLHRLRAGKFSLVVDFQGYGETAWLTRITGARRRWGSVYGQGRRWAYTHGVNRDDRLHFVDWNLSLLEQCGLPPAKIRNEFVLPEDSLAQAKQFFAKSGLDPAKPTFFIQPLTSSPHKNWPLENFIVLAQYWQAHGVQILFGGGPAEAVALEPARQAGFVVAAGVPLMVTGGLVKLSTVIAGGDTGILHLAVALGRRVVMLAPSAVYKKTFPFEHPDWALVPERKGIENIEVATVIEACSQAFRDRGVILHQ